MTPPNISNSDKKLTWNEYIQHNNNATIFHDYGLKQLIEQYYGYKGYYLTAENNGVIKGVLPLFFARTKPFGKILINVPFGASGLLADDNDAQEELIKKAQKLGDELKVDFLEFRQFSAIQTAQKVTKENVEFILPLSTDTDQIWKNALQAEARNLVRKAIKSKIIVKEDISALKDFHTIYARNMRDIGGLTYPISFMQQLCNIFPSKLFVAYHNDKMIGGLLLFCFKDLAFNLFASSLREYFRYSPNFLLYWEAIKNSGEAGFKNFNFGRSQHGSGTYLFKRQWGGAPEQVYHSYFLKNTKHPPSVGESKNKMGLALSLYKKMPVFITKIIGQHAIKQFPL